MRAPLALLFVPALIGWALTARAQDPLRELDSLGRVIRSDSIAVRQLLEGQAELAAGTPRDKAMMALAGGVVLQHFARADEAVRVIDGAIEQFGNTTDERALACAYYYRGRADLVRNNIAGAIVQFERALRITARVSYPLLDQRVEEGIGRAYAELNDYAKAREHMLRSLHGVRDPQVVFYRLSVLIEAEGKLGLVDEAERHVQRMKVLSDSAGYEPALVDLCLGELEMEHGEPEKGIPSLMKALDDYTARGSLAYVAWTMSRLSKAHRLAGRPAEAVAWGRRGLQYCAQHGLAKETQDNEQEIFQAYAALGDKDAAYDHLQRYLALKDSATGVVASGIVGTTVLRSEMARQSLVDSLLRVERDRSKELEQRSVVAGQRYIRNITLIVALGTLILAVGLWNRLRFTRRSRAEVQREKDISEHLLLNILPTEVAQELKQKGVAEARLIDHVTVLFTDFKGFTAMSEQLTPQDLVKDIHECFSAFDGIMEEYGIEKIKTIGDAYMAVGGLPTPNTTHALDVVKAALKVRDFIAEGKARKIEQGLPYFEIRIGVHTGPVVAGVVGVKKFQYDIWGDTVNTANRLETSGEVGRINISEATHELVKDEPDLLFTPRGKVQAKGKGELEMYFVEPRASAGKPDDRGARPRKEGVSSKS